MDELQRLLRNLQILTKEQWKAATNGETSPAAILQKLQTQPAWWNPQFPAISQYQRDRIEHRLRHGMRDLDRDLRVNDYIILDRLGEGGMAVVYKAWSLEMQKLVAIKRLTGNDPLLRDRQQREARILQCLDHPRIARFLAYEAVDDGESSLLCMEFIEGVTLKDYIEQHGPIRVGLAHDWLCEMLEALQHAHERGVVHRDITSKNIMILPGSAGAPPQVKLLDFGLGKLHNDSADVLTVTHEVMGTPQFMSPEQFEDTQRVTGAGDIYSLACNVYVMLTGSPPFTDSQFAVLCVKHVSNEPPQLLERRPECPLHLDRVVRQMLAKRPEARGTIPDLIAQLRGLPLSEPVSVRQTLTISPASVTTSPKSPVASMPVTRGFPALTGPLVNPHPSWLARIVRPTPLASQSRVIDPVPTHNDIARFALTLGKRCLLAGIALFAIWTAWG